MRNSNIELLRFLLMIAICIWHMVLYGFGMSSMQNGICPEGGIPEVIIMSICVPAVNCFMIISGYYGIKLSKNRFYKFLFQCFFFFWFAFILVKIFGLTGGNFDSPRFVLSHALPVSTKVWWFTTEYALIMLLSPIINAGIESISVSAFKKILLICFFIHSVGEFYNFVPSGSDFISLLLLYLLGRYLSKVNLAKYIKLSYVFMGGALLLILTTNIYLFENNHFVQLWQQFRYHNPFVVLYSVLIFIFFVSFKPRRSTIINSIGKHCFSIYLLSEMLGFTLYGQWADLHSNSNYFELIAHILIFIIICFTIDIVQMFIFNKVISKHILHE